MKIATDFFGVEGLDETFKFNAELRQEGSSSTLPPKAMLWHMWRSLTSLAPADSADPPARAKRKRGRSKADRLQANKKGKMLEKPVPPNGCYYCPHVACEEKYTTFLPQPLIHHL